MKFETKDEEISFLKKQMSKLKISQDMGKATSIQLSQQKKKLEVISNTLSKYLSPQIHEQIFSGKEEAIVKSKRKKLTVFFSDIVGFTSISDQLESEDLTNILNFYLNEMSEIAIKFGGTIDKFIGDGIMIFFGDPISEGIEQDAKNCVQMAVEMQKRMKELEDVWGKKFGLKEKLSVRIGINTGFCTVGNFGSEQRIDYTAMGSQVNLASRLEGMSNPGSIIISEETYMIVKSMYDFLKPVEINAKGFSRKIKYFEINMEESSKMHFSNISGLGYELVINEDLFEKKSLDELKIKLEKFNNN